MLLEKMRPKPKVMAIAARPPMTTRAPPLNTFAPPSIAPVTPNAASVTADTNTCGIVKGG